MNKAQARTLYDKGLTDYQIAKEIHCGLGSVAWWRESVGLPKNDFLNSAGIPMGQALSPDECDKIRYFLRCLVRTDKAAKAQRSRVDVGKFLRMFHTKRVEILGGINHG